MKIEIEAEVEQNGGTPGQNGGGGIAQSKNMGMGWSKMEEEEGVLVQSMFPVI